jgi:hypothetical protein
MAEARPGSSTSLSAGLEEPDSGNIVNAKMNMKVAFLGQEFKVSAARTVRMEFLITLQQEM